MAKIEKTSKPQSLMDYRKRANLLREIIKGNSILTREFEFHLKDELLRVEKKIKEMEKK